MISACQTVLKQRNPFFIYLMRKQRWKADDIGTVQGNVRSVRPWLFKFLWRGAAVALRPPCGVLGATLDDILFRVTLCLVCSSTFKINNRKLLVYYYGQL